MKNPLISLVFAVVASVSVVTSAVGEEVDFANGPVLCAYKFNAMAYEVGRACYFKRDKNFVLELRRALDKYKDFVVRNAPKTPEKVENTERHYRAWVHKEGFAVVGDIDARGCESIRKKSRDWYNGEIIKQKAKIQDIMPTTNLILAKDRKPIGEGCEN